MSPNHPAQNQPATALLVGTEHMLLYTRRVILERQNFTVSTVRPDDVVNRPDLGDFDVIIACHTLTPEESDLLIRTVRQRSSRPGLLGFSKVPSPVARALPFHASVWSLASPETFIGKVQEVLRRSQG